MIVVCEPQCKSISHEKVNSGFLYGIHLAFPDDKILFYADQTHIDAIKNMFVNDKINIDNIEYAPIQFFTTGSVYAFVRYYFLLAKIFTQVIALNLNKIFFLSFSPKILYLIKKLKQKNKFSSLKFSFVLHGDFENIAKKDSYVKNEFDEDDFPELKPTLKEKLLKLSITDIPKKTVSVSKKTIKKLYRPFINKFNRNFTDKKMMLWQHSSDYKYVALAPFILTNAAAYINVDELGLSSIVLPTVFAPPIPQPANDYPKFAVFGFGNPKKLRKILSKLSQKDIKNRYEIRIIGMDSGLGMFSNVFCLSPGKRMPRNEMEKSAVDIDIFLNMYTKNQYRLSCSNAILESLSYVKPTLHFDNDCINFFDTKDLPIGICCDNDDQYVEVMIDIINNYGKYHKKFASFRENLLSLRDKYAIKNYATEIKSSFTW
jgi:hypothetical protein